MIELSLSEPGGQHQRFVEIVSDYLKAESPKLLLAGFAYATTKGADTLVRALDSGPWKQIEKRFVIGVHQGITEPKALRFLSSQSNLDVRAYVPGGKLTHVSLFATPLFHPKAMLFRAGKGPIGELLVVSSANLTGNAIGANPKNFECGLVISSNPDGPIAKQFSDWWKKIWNKSQQVDPKFIDRYSALRLGTFERNPDLLWQMEPSDDIAEAALFWIEVGQASGIERHQVEFPVGLASFFGPPVKQRVDLTLTRKKSVWAGRPLSYKQTTYGVDIWRLGMPTITMGGEPIQNRVILFKRTPHVGRFEFEIADHNSRPFCKWLRESGAYGHLGRTGGSHSRQYGYV